MAEQNKDDKKEQHLEDQYENIPRSVDHGLSVLKGVSLIKIHEVKNNLEDRYSTDSESSLNKLIYKLSSPVQEKIPQTPEKLLDEKSVDVAILEKNESSKTIQQGTESICETDLHSYCTVPNPEVETSLPLLLLENTSDPQASALGDADRVPTEKENEKELSETIRKNSLLAINEIHDNVCYIRCDDGTIHEGQLLQFRKSNNPDIPDQYYVRYIGLNKKLDGWVDVHRISERAEDLEKSLPAKKMQNMTNLQKNQELKIKKLNHKSKTTKNIEKVQFGRYEIETLYSSPYPDKYAKVPIIYVCEFCLKYMSLRKSYSYHLYDCKQRKPPGYLIYRKEDIYIYEVDGDKDNLYCQFLCLLAKLFLENKGLFYDPTPFYFYIMCVKDQDGEHIVGYFAKDKDSEENFNVNCLLVLPPHQRKGYGKLLIALSYEISRKEGFIGGPEKPLSDIGRLCYRSFWGYTILDLLRNCSSTEQITIKEISKSTGFLQEDILYTLKAIKMIKYFEDHHIICTMPSIIEARLKLPQLRKPRLTIDSKCLAWKAHTNTTD
ncbi:histone acetyltransferase KAT8 [Drosophila rhopaloa]|uniref:Histone acetyltransferase n=1 Tax=Drosophila rhopaloa TaxID=1041015 RepID=A0A6P4EVA5_DRORH|nr:histone acetyltransferase KAT8 [Drosophila rhopaloa]